MLSGGGIRAGCVSPCVSVFQGCSQRGYRGVVGAAHGSRAGIQCCLRCVPGCSPAHGVWSHLLPAAGGRIHSQVRNSSLGCTALLPVPHFSFSLHEFWHCHLSWSLLAVTTSDTLSPSSVPAQCFQPCPRDFVKLLLFPLSSVR